MKIEFTKQNQVKHVSMRAVEQQLSNDVLKVLSTYSQGANINAWLIALNCDLLFVEQFLSSRQLKIIINNLKAIIDTFGASKLNEYIIKAKKDYNLQSEALSKLWN